MELKIENGKYLPGRYSGLDTVWGSQELAQRITMKLTSRRGGFAPLPDYGSRLYLLTGLKPSERLSAARQYVTEALSDEPDVTLDDVSVAEGGNGELLVSLSFTAGGDTLAIETTVEGA
jgi:phage baseplate assembly protein W